MKYIPLTTDENIATPRIKLTKLDKQLGGNE